jgi:prolyl-tRNA editing enzyme YbaK/EbsC (Cys-tRNA(Pro) deacylase)
MNLDLTKYHPVVNQIINLLYENNCWFEFFEHEEVRTSEEAAKVRTGYTLQQGAKAIIIRIKKNGQSEFRMLVIPGNCRFDNDKVKKVVESGDIRFATSEEIDHVTNGILPGGVPPFGNLFNLKIIADPSLFENEKIIFNAGDRRFSIAMKSSDFQNLSGSVIQTII